MVRFSIEPPSDYACMTQVDCSIDFSNIDFSHNMNLVLKLDECEFDMNSPLVYPRKLLHYTAYPKLAWENSKPKIKKVIFNDPATVIFWNDGTKTVVKCQEGDTYSKETGFVMCYLKKLLGDDNTFNKEITKWVTSVE